MELKFQTLRDLIAMPMSSPKFVVGQWLLPEGGNMMLYGRQGSWKSWMAIDLALAVASGGLWLHRFETSPGRVMVLQTEQPAPMYRHRVMSYLREYEGRIPESIVLCTSLEFRIDTPAGAQVLKKSVAEFEPSLVILDDVYHIMSNPTKEEMSVRKYIDVVDSIRTVSTAAWCHIHHPRKAEAEAGISSDELYGSALFGWWADTIIRTVLLSAGAEPSVRLEFQKVKNAEEEVEDVTVDISRTKLRFAVR